jgi:hypothetical protein
VELVGWQRAAAWSVVVVVPVIVLAAARRAGAAWLLWALFAGAVALTVFVWAVARHYEDHRSAALSEGSEKLGLSFQGEESPFGAADERALMLLTAGYSRQLRNVMRGHVEGREVVLFEFQYSEERLTRRHRVFDQTVAAFPLGRLVPEFQLTLRPSSALFQEVTVGEAFSGFKPVDLPAPARFARRWMVRARDEEAVRRLFGRAVIEFFEKHDPGGGWVVEGGGRWLLVYQPEQRVREGELSSFVRRTSRIASAFA